MIAKKKKSRGEGKCFPLPLPSTTILPCICTPALLSFGWSSIGLPSDHTFIQEDDIEAIDSMVTLDIKSHHYGDTWVSIIFVQQNIYFVQKTALKKMHVAGYTISQNISIHLGTIYVDKTDIYFLEIQDDNGVKTRLGEGGSLDCVQLMFYKFQQ